TRWPRDWSSDVCSSDLERVLKGDKSVSKNQEGVWQTPEELVAALGGGNGGGGGRGRGFGRGGFGGANTMPDVQAKELLAGVKERSEERRVGKECETGWE